MWSDFDDDDGSFDKFFLDIFQGCQRAGQKLYERAKNAHDEHGDIWPIWGTCNGFEMLAYFSNNYHPVLTNCSSHRQTLSLDMTEDAKKSRIIKQMPNATVSALANENVTVNYHQYCVTPETFNRRYLLQIKLMNIIQVKFQL